MKWLRRGGDRWPSSSYAAGKFDFNFGSRRSNPNLTLHNFREADSGAGNHLTGWVPVVQVAPTSENNLKKPLLRRLLLCHSSLCKFTRNAGAAKNKPQPLQMENHQSSELTVLQSSGAFPSSLLRSSEATRSSSTCRTESRQLVGAESLKQHFKLHQVG